MKSPSWVRIPALVIVTALLATCSPRATVDPGYAAEVEHARAQREDRLRASDGWLSLVGLYWLAPGVNRFGSAPQNEVVLAAAGVPPVAGVFEVAEDGAVVIRTSAEAGITIEGDPVTERLLATDRYGRPDVLVLGTLRFLVIDRSGQLGVRVKDIDSPAREAFEGISYFPIDPSYRVEGRYEGYPTPRTTMVASAQGPDQEMLVPGVVRFTLRGAEVSLEPFVASPDDDTFFFVFRDATSGTESYGAGRFLDAAAPTGGNDTVVLDFNLAINPPCAFTPFATCPIAPERNTLPVRVEAGERTPTSHH